MPRIVRKFPRALERTELSGKNRIKTKGWSIDQRKAQSARCSATKPWESATGPRTEDGKAASSKNALRHGLYDAAYHDLSHALVMQRGYIGQLMETID